MRISSTDPRVSRCGFAKLVGKDLDFILRKYVCSMGRRSKAAHQDIVLGDVMSISRQHAEIKYSFENKEWELHVFGKNGVTVDGVLYIPETSPVVLRSQNLLQIADRSFYFLLPKELHRRPAKKRARQPHSAPTPATHAALPQQQQPPPATTAEAKPSEPPPAAAPARPASPKKQPLHLPAAASGRTGPSTGPGASGASLAGHAAAAFSAQQAQQEKMAAGRDDYPPPQVHHPAPAAPPMDAPFAPGAQHQGMQQGTGGAVAAGAPAGSAAAASHHMLMQQAPQEQIPGVRGVAMSAPPPVVSHTQSQVLQQAAAVLAQRAQHAATTHPMQGLAPGSSAQQAMQQAMHLRQAAQQAQQASMHQQYQRAQQQQQSTAGMGVNPQMAQLMMAQALSRQQQQQQQQSMQAMMLQQQQAQMQASGGQPNAATLAQMLQAQQQAQHGGGASSSAGTVNPALMQMLMGMQQQQAQRGQQSGMGYPGSQPYPGRPPM